MLRTVVLGWLLLAGSVEEHEPSAIQSRPNLVLIVVDTLRPDYLGCYGHPAAKTPNIDGLAAEGVLFENAYAHIPITGPSHASLFLSQLPSEHGVLNNMRSPLGESAPTLAEVLEVAGYHNAGVVSLHPLVGEYEYDRGFDEYVDETGLTHMLSGEEIRERALAQQSQLASPFFHFVHFSDPHEPYDAHGLVKRHATVWCDGEQLATIDTSNYDGHNIRLSLPFFREAELRIESSSPFRVRQLKLAAPRWIRPRFDRPQLGKNFTRELSATVGAMGTRWPTLHVALVDSIPEQNLPSRYLREVEFVDAQVGRVLDGLRERGVFDESWIVFTSDHGEGLGCHDVLGHVDTLYDCLTRIPLILRPPASEAMTPARRGDLASLIDVVPTLLTALGLPLPSTATGSDLFATEGSRRATATVFLETHAPQAPHTRYALRMSAEKIIWTPDTNHWELYDLTADPMESNNLCGGVEPEGLPIHERFVDRLAELYDPSRSADTAPLDEETAGILRSLGYLE